MFLPKPTALSLDWFYTSEIMCLCICSHNIFSMHFFFIWAELAQLWDNIYLLIYESQAMVASEYDFPLTLLCVPVQVGSEARVKVVWRHLVVDGHCVDRWLQLCDCKNYFMHKDHKIIVAKTVQSQRLGLWGWCWAIVYRYKLYCKIITWFSTLNA